MHVQYDRARGILEFNQLDAIEALAEKYDQHLSNVYPRTFPIGPQTDLPKLQIAEVNQRDYLSIVGSCLHLQQVSRPDCPYAIGVLTRHSSTPGKAHMQAALDLVGYLFGTKDLCVRYTRSASGNNPAIYERGGHSAAAHLRRTHTHNQRTSPSITAQRRRHERLHLLHRCRLRRRQDHKTQHIRAFGYYERRTNQLEQPPTKTMCTILSRIRNLCSHRECQRSNPYQAPLRRNGNSTTRHPNDNLGRQQRLHPNGPRNSRLQRRKTLRSTTTISSRTHRRQQCRIRAHQLQRLTS